MTSSDYISVTNTRATASVACVRGEKKKKTNHPRRNEQTCKPAQLHAQHVIAKGFELTHVILAFGSRRLDQFDVFMSPRATVNSQLVYATADRCNLVMLT